MYKKKNLKLDVLLDQKKKKIQILAVHHDHQGPFFIIASVLPFYLQTNHALNWIALCEGHRMQPKVQFPPTWPIKSTPV